MKSIKTVCDEHKDYTTVVKAVVRRIGKESITEVNEHGIKSGFSGFIYYNDTIKFWRKYRKLIVKMLEDDIENPRENIVEIVRRFACLVDNRTDEPYYATYEIGQALYGKYNQSLDIIYNALAWFAAETVCRWFDE